MQPMFSLLEHCNPEPAGHHDIQDSDPKASILHRVQCICIVSVNI